MSSKNQYLKRKHNNIQNQPWEMLGNRSSWKPAKSTNLAIENFTVGAQKTYKYQGKEKERKTNKKTRYTKLNKLTGDYQEGFWV